MTEPREITTEELFALARDPFVRHQVDRRTVERAWRNGAALVIQGGRHRARSSRPGPVLTCLGPVPDLAPLIRYVDRSLAQVPGRVTIERSARAAAPAGWRFEDARSWNWMWTREPPTVVPRHSTSDDLEADEVNAVLDVANPGSFARPGGPGVQTWLGVREGKRPVGVGALERMVDGTGHLRGVSVRPDAGGRGIGLAISHGLTVRALVDGSGIATLGVYADNAPALAIYDRLGYTTAHRFYSGAVAVLGS